MIERKIDEAGNVAGFWDTQANDGRGGWIPATDSFDTTTELTGKSIPDAVAQKRVDDKLEQAEAQAADADDADDAGEPTRAVDPNSLTKDKLTAALEAAGVTPPKNPTKLQLVELYEQTFTVDSADLTE